MSNLDGLRSNWEHATSKLPWGVHSAFTQALSLVAEEKATLVYNANFHDGSPCLVNSVATMLSHDGTANPMGQFGEVVSLFDRINTALESRGINTTSQKVSPTAAEILLRWFAPEPPKSMETQVNEATDLEAFANAQYREATDDDLALDWLNALKVDAAQEDFKPCGDNAEAEAFINEQHNA